MAVKDFIKEKKVKKKDRRHAQVSMEKDFYSKIQKVLKQKKLSWQEVLHAGLEAFIHEETEH